MTIGISLKVDEGIVLAADTTTVMTWRDPFSGGAGPREQTVSRSKIHTLSEEIRMGLLSWGAGSISKRSIGDWITLFVSDLKKNVRNLGRLRVSELANMLGGFFQGRYLATFRGSALKPDFGIAVAGYSNSDRLPELWAVTAEGGDWSGATEVRPKTGFGVDWFGMSDSGQRLVSKADPKLHEATRKRRSGSSQGNRIVGAVQEDLYAGLWDPAMPIQVALDVAAALLQTRIDLFKDFPRIPLIDGCVEFASITRLEGFQWVMRH